MGNILLSFEPLFLLQIEGTEILRTMVTTFNLRPESINKKNFLTGQQEDAAEFLASLIEDKKVAKIFGIC